MTIYAYGYSQNSRGFILQRKSNGEKNPANFRDFTNTKTFENVIRVILSILTIFMRLLHSINTLNVEWDYA